MPFGSGGHHHAHIPKGWAVSNPSRKPGSRIVVRRILLGSVNDRTVCIAALEKVRGHVSPGRVIVDAYKVALDVARRTTTDEN
jgi:hypothetical protein